MHTLSFDTPLTNRCAIPFLLFVGSACGESSNVLNTVGSVSLVVLLIQYIGKNFLHPPGRFLQVKIDNGVGQTVKAFTVILCSVTVPSSCH